MQNESKIKLKKQFYEENQIIMETYTKKAPSLAQNKKGELYIYQPIFSNEELVYLLVCVVSELVLADCFKNNASLSHPTILSNTKKFPVSNSQFSPEISSEEIAQFAQDCNNNKESLASQLESVKAYQFLRIS